MIQEKDVHGVKIDITTYRLVHGILNGEYSAMVLDKELGVGLSLKDLFEEGLQHTCIKARFRTSNQAKLNLWFKFVEDCYA